MRTLKAIKSAFEAIGMAVCIFVGYIYFGKPESIGGGDFLLALLFSVILVWLINKIFLHQAMNGEIFECPWCGGITPPGEDVNVRGTQYEKITNLTPDGMGKFLMDWGIACIRNEEPRDVFKWLESEAEE